MSFFQSYTAIPATRTQYIHYVTNNFRDENDGWRWLSRRMVVWQRWSQCQWGSLRIAMRQHAFGETETIKVGRWCRNLCAYYFFFKFFMRPNDVLGNIRKATGFLSAIASRCFSHPANWSHKKGKIFANFRFSIWQMANEWLDRSNEMSWYLTPKALTRHRTQCELFMSGEIKGQSLFIVSSQFFRLPILSPIPASFRIIKHTSELNLDGVLEFGSVYQYTQSIRRISQCARLEQNK